MVNNAELNQLIEFMQTTQVIFAIGLIAVSAISPIIVSYINNKWQKKSKVMDIYFEHRLKAYQTYTNDLFELVKITRKDISTFQTIDRDEELRSFIIHRLIPSQANAIMFASTNITDLIKKCDSYASKLVLAKNDKEYVILIEELNQSVDTLVQAIQKELRSMMK